MALDDVIRCPVARQVLGGDRSGRGAAVKSRRSKHLGNRNADADRVVKSVCPYCAVGSYDKTYGTLGAIVTFLIWAWLANIAILLGIELDSEIERERQLTMGQPGAVDRLQLPLRQE